MDEETINVVAFYYELGKKGNDFVLKENYCVPYVVSEFSTVKKMKEYIW